MSGLFIFPFNGNGKEALDCLMPNQQFLGFIDDDKSLQGEKNGMKIYSREILKKFSNAKILAVPGSPKSFLDRKNIIDGLGVTLDRFATVIHPSAQVSQYAKIGQNVLIFANSVIANSAIIGSHVCILANSAIHHDSIINNYSLIGSNVTISGHTVIGENCYIGSGSSIKDHIKIGAQTLVGLGTNVIHSVPETSRTVGNPNRIIPVIAQ